MPPRPARMLRHRDRSVAAAGTRLVARSQDVHELLFAKANRPRRGRLHMGSERQRPSIGCDESENSRTGRCDMTCSPMSTALSPTRSGRGRPSCTSSIRGCRSRRHPRAMQDVAVHAVDVAVWRTRSSAVDVAFGEGGLALVTWSGRGRPFSAGRRAVRGAPGLVAGGISGVFTLVAMRSCSHDVQQGGDDADRRRRGLQGGRERIPWWTSGSPSTRSSSAISPHLGQLDVLRSSALYPGQAVDDDVQAAERAPLSPAVAAGVLAAVGCARPPSHGAPAVGLAELSGDIFLGAGSLGLVKISSVGPTSTSRR